MANNRDSDQTAPFRSSLIRVHNVCLYDKVLSEVHLICSRFISRQHFQKKKILAGYGLRVNTLNIV